jgi:hypothetical protein
MNPIVEPAINSKKIVEFLKIVGYSLVFGVLMLAIIVAVLSKNMNLSQLFNSKDSNAFFENLKSLPRK